MAMEVVCGQCQGRLLIESPGVVVACPHCGVHLSLPVPEDTNAASPAEVAQDSSDHDAALDLHDETSSNSDPSIFGGSDFPSDEHIEVPVNPLPGIDKPDFSWMSGSNTNISQGSSTISVDDFSKLASDDDESSSNAGQFNNDAAMTRSYSYVPADKVAPVISDQDLLSSNASNSKTPPAFDVRTESGPVDLAEAWGKSGKSSPEAPVSSQAASIPRETSGSRASFLSMLLIVIGSYASLLTIYVLYTTLFGRTHQLESLPDLKTVQQRGGRALVPGPENELPPGHELKLGQSQRFGEIRVTPLRITRGPLFFTHFSGDATRERAPTEPVLKLWLKFENLSARHTIVPIDSTLMYFHRGMSEAISFNVIFPESDRKKKVTPFFYHFDRMAADSEWVIVGQNANRALAPSESYETFVPSEENVWELSKGMVWRVHIRKGYGPKTGNGVTTLIDVHFEPDQIQPDPA